MPRALAMVPATDKAHVFYAPPSIDHVEPAPFLGMDNVQALATGFLKMQPGLSLLLLSLSRLMMNKISKLGYVERLALNLVGVSVIFCYMGPTCQNYLLSLETWLCDIPHRSDVNLVCLMPHKMLCGYLLLLGCLVHFGLFSFFFWLFLERLLLFSPKFSMGSTRD